MADRLFARKEPGWLIISNAPDVCLTPMGGTTVPVPYPVTAHLDTATDVTSTLRVNGRPVLVFERSSIPTTKGDAAGSAKGMASGTVAGTCHPIERSQSVRAEGRYLVREGDLCWMNGA